MYYGYVHLAFITLKTCLHQLQMTTMVIAAVAKTPLMTSLFSLSRSSPRPISKAGPILHSTRVNHCFSRKQVDRKNRGYERERCERLM